MEKEKKKKKKINRDISPRKMISDGNLSDFIKRYPDTVKKIENFELSQYVRLSIKALPSDFKSLKSLLELNPHAFIAFIEHALINPAIAKLRAKTHKRTDKTSVIKCLRLQAALLYGFFKYCKENNEYPKFFNKIDFLTKHRSELNPSLFTAYCLEFFFEKIRTEITKQKKFFIDLADKNFDNENFKENMIDRGMKLLEQPNSQEQLNILNKFTSQILVQMRFGRYIIQGVDSDAHSDVSDAHKIFTFLYYLNNTFYRPKRSIQGQKQTMPSDNKKEKIKEETKEEKEEKERKEKERIKKIKEAMKEADEIQCIASNAFPRLYQH
ncbi:MAG: hypothetical protein WC581_02590 [Thermodesulfovibrionales bacterium]